MALQITSLMWLRTIMHLGIVSGIVTSADGDGAGGFAAYTGYLQNMV